jgi:hypothetical protein
MPCHSLRENTRTTAIAEKTTFFSILKATVNTVVLQTKSNLAITRC